MSGTTVLESCPTDSKVTTHCTNNVLIDTRAKEFVLQVCVCVCACASVFYKFQSYRLE